MHFASTAAALAAMGAGLTAAMPTIRQTNTLSPCANITQQYQRSIAANETSYFADGQLAYDCLMSMPFDSVRASAFVLELKKYVRFQSTIPVLKNPPKTYLSPAVDLLGGLDSIYQKANSSQYTSQFQMDTDISNLISSAADGHLSVSLCSVGLMGFTAGTRNSIVSISSDGITLPKLYLTSDAALLTTNTTTTVSDIVQINGQDPVEYLNKIGPSTGNQDPDAQYNNMMTSAPRGAANQGTQGSFISRGWPGSPDITLRFSNGTTRTTRVGASVPLGFNYTSGSALYEDFCLPVSRTSSSTPASSASPTTSASATPTVLPLPAQYPYPVIRDSKNIILGYYLNTTGYNDTAVLFIPTFVTGGVAGQKNFANIASIFVNRAAADGKTKMIIDVSGNGGGTITAGFDLFKLFFPDMPAYSATRQLDHEAQRLTWKSLAAANESEVTGDAEIFYYGAQVTPDQSSDFSSWEALYGPDNINGANMTNLYANFNFSDSSRDSPIRGYGGVPLNITGPLFKPENIVIMSDGHCASTCTTFVNLMSNSSFGNVRTIAFGGRPSNGPMQIMGGVRGAQSYEFEYLSQVVDAAYLYAYNRTNTTNPPLTKQELATFAEVAPLPLDSLPLRLYKGGLNLRNSYNPVDLQKPLQFEYQAASCKLFYTADSIFNPASTWLAAAQAAWGSGGRCVAGSQAANFTLSS